MWTVRLYSCFSASPFDFASRLIARISNTTCTPRHTNPIQLGPCRNATTLTADNDAHDAADAAPCRRNRSDSGVFIMSTELQPLAQPRRPDHGSLITGH